MKSLGTLLNFCQPLDLSLWQTLYALLIHWSINQGKLQFVFTHVINNAINVFILLFIIQIEYSFNSLFVIPVTSADEKKVLYEKHTLFSAFYAALSLPKLLKGSESVFATKSLQEIAADAKAHGQVVVVFAEGTTSNGKGILPLILSPEDSKEPISNAANKSKVGKTPTSPKFPTFPAAIKYSRSSITTPTPTSLLVWSWRLVQGFQFSSVRVRYASPIGDDESNASSSLSTSTSTSSSNAYSFQTYSENTYKGQISGDICRVARLKEVGLGVKAKIEFVEAQKKGAKK